VLIGLSVDADSTIEEWSADLRAVDCLEIEASGFFARPSPYLAWLSTRHQIIVRASSLSIGTAGPLNPERLRSITDVSEVAQCRFVVHPLGFSESDAIQLGIPVPITFTETSLSLVAEHVIRATDVCGRPSLIEPIAAPLRVRGTVAETDFLNRLCRQAGCRMLIDVTTVLVTSRNFRFDPHAWLADIDGDLIAATRITGCSFRNGRWHADSHENPDEAAWALMHHVAARAMPEVLILGARQPSRIDHLRCDLQRLRAAGHAAPGTDASKKRVESQGAVNEDGMRRRSNVGAKSVAKGHAQTVRVSPDAALFVLDDAGILFSAARQELSLCNTSATLIWCLVEEGLSVQEIIESYGQALSLDEAEATDHVSASLRQWFGLGHISNPNLSSGPDVPFTTALAELLTNEDLRNQFKHDRWELAEELRVNREDAESFVQLDPDELDAQAEEVAQRRSSRRKPREVDASSDSEPGTVGAPMAHVEFSDRRPPRRYRLLTTTFEIRSDADGLDAQIHEALAHLECPDSIPDIALVLRQSESDGWAIFNGTKCVEHCRRSEEVVPTVKRFVREASLNRSDLVMRVHAAVVSFGSGCVVMPASAGSGKTTLTAALIRSGATYLSDEIALVERAELAVRPVPLALTIKEGSVEPLKTYYPEIDTLTVHLREDYVRVRYLPPPAASLPGDERAQPVKWIVFPHYDSGAETLLCPLARPLAFKRLLDESFVDFNGLDRGTVESLVHGMRTVECFDLSISSLEIAAALVRSVVGSADR
jgi:uncharacterized protein (UPF0276 family)